MCTILASVNAFRFLLFCSFQSFPGNKELLNSHNLTSQFNDTRIIEYLTHQRRLFPALATTYALHLSTDALKVPPPLKSLYLRSHSALSLCSFAATKPRL